MPLTDPESPSHAQAWKGFLATLRPLPLALSIGLAAAAALLLSPIFILSFPVLLGRTLFFVGLLGLLSFAASSQWPRRLPKWLARWAPQVVVVALTVPLATLLVYLASVGGDIGSLLQSEPRILGFIWIAGSASCRRAFAGDVGVVPPSRWRGPQPSVAFELERSELERQALNSQLRLLQAQVEPHFLFNTLANVRALVETGSPQAAPVLQSLIAYLRAAMPRLANEAASLGDELALVSAYLDLMHMRMPDRLRYHRADSCAAAGLALSADGLADAGGKRRPAWHRPKRGGRLHQTWR